MSESDMVSVECPLCGEMFDPTAAGGWCTNSECGEWKYDEVATGDEQSSADATAGDPGADSSSTDEWSAGLLGENDSEGESVTESDVESNIESDGEVSNAETADEVFDQGESDDGSEGDVDEEEVDDIDSTDVDEAERDDETAGEDAGGVEGDGDVESIGGESVDVDEEVGSSDSDEEAGSSDVDEEVGSSDADEEVGSSDADEEVGSSDAEEDSAAGAHVDENVADEEDAGDSEESVLESCPSCGEDVVDSDSFCAHCGEGLEAHRRAADEPATCPDCGTEVESSDSFCSACGADLSTDHAGSERANSRHNAVDTTDEGSASGSPAPVALALTALGSSVVVADGDSVGREIRSLLTDAGQPEDEAVRVHREHVRFVREDGQFYVIDLGDNPTRINDITLKKGDREPIAPGDELELSDVVTLNVETV